MTPKPERRCAGGSVQPWRKRCAMNGTRSACISGIATKTRLFAFRTEPRPRRTNSRNYIPTARPGSRAPHVWLVDGRSTLDLFGKGFVLLRIGAHVPDAGPLVEAARQQRVPLEVMSIDEPAVTSAYERRLVLVRPDGHVAWRGDDLGDARLIINTICGLGEHAGVMSPSHTPPHRVAPVP